MDSPNSGSLQSSSDGLGGGGGGGDDDSISSFLNHPILQPPPPPSSSSSHHHHHHNHNHHQTLNTTFFDHPSSTSYLFPPSNSNPTNPNPGYDPIWSRNPRPDPNFTTFGGVATQNDDVYLNSQQNMYQNPNNPNHNNHSPAVNSNANPVGVVNKNLKKRTRDSRRAPTTVLTTDTTNFRQMVQEFTGIPTPPFSAAAPFSRRLDLFSGGGGGGGRVGFGPVYPVRPSPVKIQPSIISSVDNLSSNSYQLRPSEIQSFQKQPQSLLNSQNGLFSFQSLLQTKLSQQGNLTILDTTNSKSDDQRSDLLGGFPSSSTRWRDQDEKLVDFDGGDCSNLKVDGYKLNSLDIDHQREKGLENVVSSRNGGDQTQGNVDSWLCPSD